MIKIENEIATILDPLVGGGEGAKTPFRLIVAKELASKVRQLLARGRIRARSSPKF